MLLLGVTVLTSADEATLRETGVDSPMEEQVLRLAKLGAECWNRRCGRERARAGRRSARAHGTKIKIVTPGIRPLGSAADDQKRAMTPAEALKAGADFLVIGRPITAAQNPRAALEQIVADAV